MDWRYLGLSLWSVDHALEGFSQGFIQMSILLETENLTKFFGTKLVFKDLDFQVNFGEVILILGANGSGKSTLLKILSGLVAPTYGKIKAGVNPENIGYMGHESFHYPWLSAVENLRFWASVYNIRDNDRIIDRWI